MENKPENKNEEVPALKILKQINDGELDPKSLTTPQRRQCVEVLKIEGHSYASIAKLLNWSEKTIQRDWDDICKKNAQKPSPELALKLISQLIMKANAKEDYLTRLANAKEGSVQEKAQSMYYASKVLIETIQLLQSMGYVPTQPTQIVGDIYHHTDEEIDIDDLKKEVAKIEKIISEEGIDNPAIKQKLETLKNKIEQGEINKGITDLKKEVSGQVKKPEEDSNE